MVKIEKVECGSRAEKAGIRAGDILLKIGGNPIGDVLDYRFYLTDTLVMLECSRDGQTFEVTLRKEEYDDIGLVFDTPLMDKKQSCRNKCIFCFIDQLPGGMRESLYFKDDDARLSFLHGNYITLTNLSDNDIDRILKMHISPVNVSVHTTNPELRVKMMNNKRAGEVLSYLDRLAEGGIRIAAQIVLCKNINDGKELERSMRDLCRLLPALSGVSIVPAGLTDFRDGLYPLEAYTPGECREIIGFVNRFGDECLRKYGTRVFFLADEFYVKAGLPIPPDEYYEEYSQIENGVGMLRSLEEEFGIELSFLEDDEKKLKRHVSIATGKAAAESIGHLCDRLEEAVPGLRIDVYPIENRTFGASITVAGLLTGKDIAVGLEGKELGDELLLPAATLRAGGDLFLCGMTPAELSEKLGIGIRFVPNDGAELVAAILGRECADADKDKDKEEEKEN